MIAPKVIAPESDSKVIAPKVIARGESDSKGDSKRERVIAR